MNLKKNKLLFIFIWNFILVFSLLIISEIVFVGINVNSLIADRMSVFQEVSNPKIPKISLFDYIGLMKKTATDAYFEDRKQPFLFKDEFRMPYTGASYKGDDIVLAGCSITKGDAIKSEDTFGAVLSEICPKYRAYNIGVSGGSARETLYILRNYNEFQKWGVLPENPKNTKYFIYTFFDEHKLRIYHDLYRRGPKFNVKKDKNGQKYLEYNDKPNIFTNTFIYKYFTLHYCFKSEKYLNNLLTLYIQELKKEVDLIFPNAQFVFFVFWGDEDTFDMPALEKMGIKVLILGNLTDIPYWEDKYTAWDNVHPNRRAWENFVPILAKKLNL